MSARSVVWSKMVRNAPCGCGRQVDIFSSHTTRHTSKSPEAMWYQAWMGEKTPVPPPT